MNDIVRADFRSGNLFAQPQSSSPSPQQAEEARLAALSGTPEIRAEFARAVTIQTDKYLQITDYIENLIARAKRSKYPGGLWLLAEGGHGKTFILESIYRRHPSTDTHEARICPVLSLTFSSKPSKSDLFLSLLMQLGQDPDLLSYDSVDDLEDILVDAMRQCQTRAVLFDESQHLWLKSTGKYNDDRRGGIVGDTLKLFYGRTGVAFIFAGTPGLKSLYDVDGQANTRWAGIRTLNPFEFDKKFLGLIDALDCALPMPQKADLMRNMARPLFDACRGSFRILKDIIAEAVYLAACDNAPSVERKHLSKAYFNVTCSENNPFEAA